MITTFSYSQSYVNSHRIITIQKSEDIEERERDLPRLAGPYTHIGTVGH